MFTDECQHISGPYICNACGEEVMQRKEESFQKEIRILLPKHGYGVPPDEIGVYFTKTDNSYWSIEKCPKGMEDWTWSSFITEYFGPIPFEVWDAAKKEEEKALEDWSTQEIMTAILELQKVVFDLREEIKTKERDVSPIFPVFTSDGGKVE